MKILFAADVPPDPNSGAAGTEVQTVSALRALGHEVDTIWADGLPHRIRHANLHYLLELPGAFRAAVAARFDDASYDVVHVNQPYAWLAARAHRRSRRPAIFVNRSHGWEPRVVEALRPWRRRYKVPEWAFPRGVAGRPMRCVLHGVYPRLAVRYSDGVIVSSSEDRDYIVRRYPVAAWRVACIAQAPADPFTDGDAPPMTPERATRVLYAGTTSFVKAPHVLAGIFSQLAETCPALTFTWLCPESSHANCRRLLSVSAQTRVTFRGWMSQADLVRQYDQHGFFIFPSFSEGFGKAFLEAMARGLCVVASRAGGMRDVIRDGISGHLVAPGDIDGFCRKVARMLSSDELQALSRTAAADARAYSWQRVAKETASFYRVLRASGKGGGS